MGRGYVDMYKLEENSEFVWYRFETPVFEEGLIDYSKGSYKKRSGVFMANGYCKFNKRIGKFEVDEVRTDPYFFKDKFWIGAAHVILHKIYEAGLDYPEITGWAS